MKLETLSEDFKIDSPKKSRNFWLLVKKHNGHLQGVATELGISIQDVQKIMNQYSGSTVLDPKDGALRFIYRALIKNNVPSNIITKLLNFHKTGSPKGHQHDDHEVAVQKVIDGSKLIALVTDYTEDVGLKFLKTEGGWIIFKPENEDIARYVMASKSNSVGKFTSQIQDAVIGLALGYPVNEVYNWVKFYNSELLEAHSYAEMSDALRYTSILKPYIKQLHSKAKRHVAALKSDFETDLRHGGALHDSSTFHEYLDSHAFHVTLFLPLDTFSHFTKRDATFHTDDEFGDEGRELVIHITPNPIESGEQVKSDIPLPPLVQKFLLQSAIDHREILKSIS